MAETFRNTMIYDVVVKALTDKQALFRFVGLIPFASTVTSLVARH